MLPSVADVDFALLSDDNQATLDEIAKPMADRGASIEEMASELGLDSKEVHRRLEALGLEMRRLAGVSRLPDLNQEDYDALKESMRQHGQLVPILVDSDGTIVDGRHRERACRELGLEPEYRLVAEDELAADERQRLALVVNLARRQLTAGARRGLVADELVRDPSRSDRSIAIAIGVSHPFVASVRRELEARNRVETVSTRTDSSGRRQPARKPQKAARHIDTVVHVRLNAELEEQLLEGGTWRACRAIRLVPAGGGVYALEVR